MGGTHRRRRVLGADHLVHARLIFVAREQVVEGLDHIRLGAFRQFFRSKRRLHDALGAVVVALSQQGARQREPAFRGDRLVRGKGMNGGRIAFLLPQMGFGATAQQHGTGPFRIVRYKRHITTEMGERIRVAQDEPFREFLRCRVGDGFCGIGRVIGLGAARQFDDIFHDRRVAGELWLRPFLIVALLTRRLVVFSPRLRVPSLLLLFCVLGVLFFFLRCVLALMPRSFRPGLMRGFFVAGGERIAGSPRKGHEHEQTRQRPKQLDHSVVPL